MNSTAESFINADHDIENLTSAIAEEFRPEQIILFGSFADGRAKEDSDIDICLIIDNNERVDLRKKIKKYLFGPNSKIGFGRAVDIVIYTPEQWARLIEESDSFAYEICKKGVVVYG